MFVLYIAIKILQNWKKFQLHCLSGIEPGALSVWDSHDNHYTTETASEIH